MSPCVGTPTETSAWHASTWPPLSRRRSNRVRGTGWSVEAVEYVVTLISDGTRLQVDQALAQGPEAKKGRARETEACRNRSKAQQQPTAERLTQFGCCPLPGSTTEQVAVAFCRNRTIVAASDYVQRFATTKLGGEAASGGDCGLTPCRRPVGNLPLEPPSRRTRTATTPSAFQSPGL
jgi:hypothetical protein